MKPKFLFMLLFLSHFFISAISQESADIQEKLKEINELFKKNSYDVFYVQITLKDGFLEVNQFDHKENRPYNYLRKIPIDKILINKINIKQNKTKDNTYRVSIEVKTKDRDIYWESLNGNYYSNCFIDLEVTNTDKGKMIKEKFVVFIELLQQ